MINSIFSSNWTKKGLRISDLVSCRESLTSVMYIVLCIYLHNLTARCIFIQAAEKKIFMNISSLTFYSKVALNVEYHSNTFQGWIHISRNKKEFWVGTKLSNIQIDLLPIIALIYCLTHNKKSFYQIPLKKRSFWQPLYLQH